MTIQVTGCGECPFCRFGYTVNIYYCDAIQYLTESDSRALYKDNNDKPITPSWCPLVDKVTVEMAPQTLEREH